MLLGETQESLKERGTGTQTAFKLPLHRSKMREKEEAGRRKRKKRRITRGSERGVARLNKSI